MKFNLPKSIQELSNISEQNKLALNWSGAVVMLMVEDHFVFIRRSLTMPTHKGQIGFIGGHKKDDEIDPVLTAKREFLEESSLNPSKLVIHGLLDPVITAKKRVIIPVLCEIDMQKDEFLGKVTSNGEWENIVLCPVEYLKQPKRWSYGNYNAMKSYPVYFASLSHQVCHYLYTSERPYLLWGASAKMVLSFYSHMSCDR